jgi:hypothetical protein
MIDFHPSFSKEGREKGHGGVSRVRYVKVVSCATLSGKCYAHTVIVLSLTDLLLKIG